MTVDIPEALRYLREVRLARDDAKYVFDQAETTFKQMQAEVFALMAEAGVGTTTVDGIKFTPSSTTYATVQNRAEFVEWAQENAPDLLVLKENGEVNQLVRNCIADNVPLPPGLGSYDREYISQPRGGTT